MTTNYGADDLRVLEGLEAVRVRPGMYIGSTSSRGLHHLIWEIVDNAIDETIQGYADTVEVTLHADNSVSVSDNGRGIPVDVNAKTGLTGVELVFTQLHAGGKFDNNNYSFSSGLHGVGASVVNALSRWLVCEVYSGGAVYRQRFESVADRKGNIKAGIAVTALEKIGNTRKKGSVISFLPDDRIFETLEFSYDTIANRLKELSYLNPKVKIRLMDLRGKEKKSEEFYSEGGLAEFIQHSVMGKTPLIGAPILLQDKREGVELSAAILYTDSYSESLFSYANNVPTTEGGMHEMGFRTALTRAYNEYARRRNIGKDVTLAGEDFRDGMTAILSIKLENPLFEGQTKGKLGNTEARTYCESIVFDQMTRFLDDIKNQPVANIIMEKAVQSAKVREAARRAKDVVRKKNSLEGSQLVGKLSSCTGRDASENELFIVEGDSAGGSAKQGRDRRFQAILSLRGKPLNVEKKRLNEVLANEEFRTIITALGTGIDSDFDLTDLKYNKIIILADADQDGAHIRAILLTFFFRYMRPLITNGNVYIGMPPLYRVSKGSNEIYAYDDLALSAALRDAGKGATVQRYKGLGEMNPGQLWETTMDPAHRRLMQVTLDDFSKAETMVSTWMGDSAEARRNYINNNINFNKEDSFKAVN